jgi:hypothetical protein
LSRNGERHLKHLIDQQETGTLITGLTIANTTPRTELKAEVTGPRKHQPSKGETAGASMTIATGPLTAGTRYNLPGETEKATG